MANVKLQLVLSEDEAACLLVMLKSHREDMQERIRQEPFTSPAREPWYFEVDTMTTVIDEVEEQWPRA